MTQAVIEINNNTCTTYTMKMGEDKVNSNSKAVKSNVFDLFKPLVSDDANENINGSVELLKYFAKNDVRSSHLTLQTFRR